ncbi:tubulin-specific chaperone E-like [Tropilaelaps mercedesae]|uniref:Tubulin-specific chaperone E n=1 Tax=Tropilaelaps mercedesae TaxID=418985 RepID=A0A1V9XQQ4_9ACAR|nr:tubulin-specific chaperone E-like [Tropilaelaps mercedesae]
METTPPVVVVGQRVSVDGCYATVRFQGAVKGTQGIWIGVEWDDSSRGKHNGCYNGTQYFKTRHTTGGSFVRPSKAELGISVTEAIKAKYLEHEKDEKAKSLKYKQNTENEADVWLLGNIGNARSNIKMIEFVGPEKVSELQSRQKLLKIVNLHNLPVSSAGREIPSVAPFISELDLSHTLLSHWDTVALIAQQLPQLTELKLGKNHLRVPSLVTKHQEAFQSVKRISLEASNLTWEHILQLAPMWPHIEVLEVSANNINSLASPPKSLFFNLQTLSLQENPISSWQEVSNLANLPKLRELFLNGCRLQGISFPSPPGRPTEQFANLERLEVAGNLLNSWRSIAELEKLIALRMLRVNGNPVMETAGSFDEVFNEILCRLGRVTNLNRMEVPRETRKNAELYYLKKFFMDYQRSQSGAEDEALGFLALHPRFPKLLNEYGEPTIAVTDNTPANIKKTLITLKFVAVDNPSLMAVEKKVPSSMSLANLKKMVNVMFKIPGKQRPELTYYPTDERFGDGRPEYDFGNDLRDLNYYDIQNGDKIFVRW